MTRQIFYLEAKLFKEAVFLGTSASRLPFEKTFELTTQPATAN